MDEQPSTQSGSQVRRWVCLTAVNGRGCEFETGSGVEARQHELARDHTVVEDHTTAKGSRER